MSRFWISWYGENGVFELHSPWWVSGYRDDDFIFCAAVIAPDEAAAKAQIVETHDEPVELEWRFAEERPDDWTPFCGRFPRSPWMRWLDDSTPSETPNDH
ncbi:hypothetical protein [Phenylobacterium sp.]|uniref:hypothetical protein n=1 Tax=Phenylobacterium sp. TaxID=1871053 RepID=UPI002737FBDC|nr:hypothetical protein [Phenylobacterium sp.]MDP3869168.1 hypothetical protein [Phenylobacterium sp.]